MAQVLRVIGGKWRSTHFTFAKVKAIRPTPERLRETLFNWLQFEIIQAKCLDLFAGSGALGIEALSRGADFVDFVDNNQKAVAKIHQNLSLLKSDNFKTHNYSALRFIKETTQKYDLIFLDPPFDSKLLNNSIDLIISHGILADSGLLYLETNQQQIPAPLSIVKQSKSGQSHGFLAKL